MYSDLKLLIVDDNLINHRIVKFSLRGFIDEVDTAVNGKDAVEKHKNNHYDVILMDSLMPVMNGCEATAEIRSFEKEIEKKSLIIALTASDSYDTANKCEDEQADAYLCKPFNKDQFLKILKEKL